QISYRVGTNLDALILVFSSYYDTAYANAHVNLSTTWQTSMNSLFHVGMGPGYMNPQFELAHLLGVRGDQSGHDVMTGYSWGIFAYTYQLFGYWGAVVTGLMFYLFGKSFTALMKHPPSLTRDLLMFAVAHFMELFLTTFGLENMFARYERIAVTIVVAVYLMRRLPKAKDAGTSIRGREIPLLS
ncbi:MAG: hypothetical protein KGL56_12565, partial [Alphaproteobacteria bacterium]|nr:hypothetical protein [Alphaproteobacteria bacterium]